MCCGTGRHHGFQGEGHRGACFCGCDEPAYFRPRFISKKQRVARLEGYLEDLREEVKAVEEHIAEIKKKK